VLVGHPISSLPAEPSGHLLARVPDPAGRGRSPLGPADGRRVQDGAAAVWHPTACTASSTAGPR